MSRWHRSAGPTRTRRARVTSIRGFEVADTDAIESAALRALQRRLSGVVSRGARQFAKAVANFRAAEPDLVVSRMTKAPRGRC